jgi:hypothetical protein
VIAFIILDKRMDPEYLGIIPMFFDANDPRPAKEQIDEAYQHGGGWEPIPHTKAVPEIHFAFRYPDDPVFKPLAIAKLRDEMIVLYDHSFLGIWQRDGTFEISRVD